MVLIRQRITLVQTRKPQKITVNDELRWFGESLGLFSERDRDKSCYRLFLELIKAAKTQKLTSSDELAELLGLSRGTVVHHLIKLRRAGLVLIEGKRYVLRADNLEVLVDDIRRDVERTCEEMKHAAKEIDEMLGL
ncbi:MAG: ArsR family transcriptional regulator [Candidatus Aenigmarchaeota archaeon]|nr:ArsR family transcriptional regulator [Candidatus Aenigmarchaeota archaeon]